MIKSISALGVDGNTYAATITNVGSAVALSGAGVGQTLTGIAASPNTGVGSGNGNATISFGGVALTSLTFTFDSSPGGPSYQDFAISNISFNPIPETSAGLCTALLCLGAGMVEAYRRRHATQRSKRGL